MRIDYGVGSVLGDGGWSSHSDLHAISRTSPGRRPAASCECGFEPMREFLPIERWLPIAELGIDSARTPSRRSDS